MSTIATTTSTDVTPVAVTIPDATTYDYSDLYDLLLAIDPTDLRDLYPDDYGRLIDLYYGLLAGASRAAGLTT